MNFRADINGLRALAVVCVVLFHSGVPGFSGGYVGVDVFFVISGFLMTQVITSKLQAERFSLADFYWARTRRIVPALCVLLAFLLVAGAFALLPLAYQQLAKQAGASIAFVSNITLWRESGYFDIPSQRKWLLHTWSLSVEWQFYLLYPLFLLALQRWRAGRSLRAGVLVALFSSLVLCVVGTWWKPIASFFWLPTRAWEMLAGATVYLWQDRLQVRGAQPVGLALIALSTVLYREELFYPGHRAIAPVLGAALVIAARHDSLVLTNPVARFLGKISYSLYLWHWPLLVAARRFVPEPGAATLGGFVLGSLVVASVSYELVEAPFARVRDHALGVRYGRYCLGAAATLAAGAAVIYGAAGFPRRVPELAARNEAVSSVWLYPGDCVFAHDLCELGQPTHDHVLFWGDSHIEHLYPAITQLLASPLGRSQQALLAAHDGCLPIRGIDHAGFHLACEDHNQATFRRALAPDVHAVVIGAYWRAYFAERICQVVGRSCQELGHGERAYAVAQANLVRDVQALSAHGKRVYLLWPMPTYPYDVANYVAEHIWSGKPRTMRLTRAQHELDNARVRAMLAQAQRAGGALKIDPADLLCSGGECAYERDGLSLYMDKNHLTPRAARWLAPALSAAWSTSAPAAPR